MPPTIDPFRQRIMEDMQTALQAINGGTTYFNTVKALSVVLDPSLNIVTIPVTELPYVVIESTPNGSRFYQPANRLRNVFQTLVTWRQDATGTASDRKMKLMERAYYDIEKALLVDRTRGGPVIDTRLEEPTMAGDFGTGNMCIVMVPVNLTLIREYGSP